ncbi:MAG: hypothetical protein OEW42_10000 [Acidimicrobiia bacterium]|nr:hypothetical protein [Acidimicrobiia bacterium]
MTESAFVLGVDLDGVCGDYTAAFREVVADELGVPLESLPLERSWSFREWGLDEARFQELHREAVVNRHIFREMDVLDGASESLWRLSDAGVWIRVITHRLYVNWGHATTIADTVAWLDRHRIPYRDLCFLGAKPEVEADAYIDDGPHNVIGLRERGNTVICFDQPYNRDIPGLRAHDWAEVEHIVLGLAAEGNYGIQVQLPGFPAGSDRLDRNTAAQRMVD